MKIEDCFCGYVSIDGKSFAYSFSDQMVTLLPALNDSSRRNKAVENINNRDIKLPEFIYGEDNSAQIAFMRTSNFSQSHIGFVPSLRFSPPLIIKAVGNADGFYNSLSEKWNNFHAITFWGGNINAICDPQMAIVKRQKDDQLPQDGVTEIRTRPWNDYTRTIDFVIDDQRVTLTVSVYQSGESYDKDKNDAYLLGELNTLIRFSFEESQGFSCIEKYYLIARKIVAFLTKQNNVTFYMYLSQRNDKGQFVRSAICKAFDGCENYSKRNRYCVIPLISIFECLPSLIEKISSKQLDTLFSVLPDNNHRINMISISNVQDLCTALEVAYGWGKQKRSKDELIEELKKQIKGTISCFMSDHSEINVYNESTISSAFQYLDYTLKEKIETLYQENKETVDIISKKWSLPYLTKENITAFVKLRNGKTHSGMFEWGESAEIYPVLLGLAYICTFNSIGLSHDTVNRIIFQNF